MKYLVPVIFSVSVLSGSAFAQTETNEWGPAPTEGDWEITVSGSGVNDRDFDRGNFNLAGELGHYMSDTLLLGLRQDVSWAGGTDVSDIWTGATRGVIAWHFPMERFRPFIGANLGYKYGSRDFNDTWTAGPEIGVKWYAEGRAFIFGRMGYDWEFDDFWEIEDETRRGSFVYSVGVGYNF